ncbi:MAG: hypothetical protein NZM43_09215 [Saprospiraceae bacterium]|nr:hypothetical protein [Saprospiraceae bacterium]MDW8484493.1 hypothetical protein [Saprospiraceae bacterium]
MWTKRGLLLLNLFFLIGPKAKAQDIFSPGPQYILVRTTDNNVYSGRLLRMDSTEVVIQTIVFDKIAIPRSAVRRLRPVSVNHTRLDFAPEQTSVGGIYLLNGSAYGIPPRQKYYSSFFPFYHHVGIGLSNGLSVRGHFALFADNFELPTWIAPKISIPILKEKLIFAAEGLLGRGFAYYIPPLTSDFGGFQLMLTIGSRMNNLSVGSGLAWFGGYFPQRPFFSFSGIVQLAKRLSVQTENYVFRQLENLIHMGGLGLRYHGRWLNIEAGSVFQTGGDLVGVQALPWLAVSVNFY